MKKAWCALYTIFSLQYFEWPLELKKTFLHHHIAGRLALCCGRLQRWRSSPTRVCPTSRCYASSWKEACWRSHRTAPTCCKTPRTHPLTLRYVKLPSCFSPPHHHKGAVELQSSGLLRCTEQNIQDVSKLTVCVPSVCWRVLLVERTKPS